MRQRLKELAILGAFVGLIGLIVLVSGVFPIKASSGHWAVTRWVLDFASDRSIAFHSRGVETPPLDEPEMITLGAATYESNCVFCHGRPGEEQPPVAKGMTPTPPVLSDAVANKSPEELFYVIKHGIKFAGMPAWPTQNRDDEIWPVVAFLRTLSDLDLKSYRKHVEPVRDDAGETSRVRLVVNEHCAACHGSDGNGLEGQSLPILAGQSEPYLRESLQAYRAGERTSGIMMPVAHRLTDSQINELAEYFSTKKPLEESVKADFETDTIALGKQLAELGDQDDKIPSCVDCHGPGPILRSDEYPALAGQPALFIERQLKLFSNRHRGGSEDASLMHPIADKLSQKQRQAVAAYYATVSP